MLRYLRKGHNYITASHNKHNKVNKNIWLVYKEGDEWMDQDGGGQYAPRGMECDKNVKTCTKPDLN